MGDTSDEEESPQKFRVNRKKFGLTYSCPVDADDNPIESKEALLSFLERFGPLQYIVAVEPHKSGKAHYHVFAKYDVAINSSNSRIFDLNGVHPNIISPGKGWEGYCVKQPEYITNYYERGSFKRAAEAVTWTEAADILWEREPKFMLQHGTSVESNWKRRKISSIPDTVYFGPHQPLYPEWKPAKKTLYVEGAAGTGKTQWAYYWARHQGGYFKCKNYFHLKGYCGQPVIIFDDCVIKDEEWGLEEWKNLFDVEGANQYGLNGGGGGGVAVVPAGVIRIFLCNGTHRIPWHEDAIATRCEKVKWANTVCMR